MPPAGARRADEIVVASFNFAESRLLAEIYAGALEQAGLRVRRELDLGPRELVTPALLQGFVDVVPEYLGTALSAVAPEVPVVGGDRDAAMASLRAAMARHDVRVLAPAAAQNQNAVVVRRQTAERLGLTTIGDLSTTAPSLTFGGPPECPTRRYCEVGLTDVYGLRFGRFIPLTGSETTRRALQDGVVDVGIMFTTDGNLATHDLVTLADDHHLQPPENIVPVARVAALDRHGDRVAAALDDVSSRLTTPALRLLNWRVSVARRDPRAEARGWLIRQGIVPR